MASLLLGDVLRVLRRRGASLADVGVTAAAWPRAVAVGVAVGVVLPVLFPAVSWVLGRV